MPIRLPDDLPARAILAREGLQVLRDGDPRPYGMPTIRIALLNLMPDKPATEVQFARLLAGTDYDIDLVLARPDAYVPRKASPGHMARHYRPLSDVMARRIDGFIVTGAPVECLPFSEVTYWEQLCKALDWSERSVARSLFICWAGQAALWHRHGVPKHEMPAKLSGVYEHRVTATDVEILRGFPENFLCPVSRHTEVRVEDLPEGAGLRVLANSTTAGLCMVEDPRRRALYMFNHLEYDAETLRTEYVRDLAAGREVPVPHGYFPDDDISATPVNRWRRHGERLIRNWVDGVYMTMVREAA